MIIMHFYAQIFLSLVNGSLFWLIPLSFSSFSLKYSLQCWANLCCAAKLLSYTHIYILFYILFHYRLSQDIEYSSLCYTLGPCFLSILYIIVCIHWPQTPSPSLSSLPLPVVYFFLCELLQFVPFKELVHFI